MCPKYSDQYVVYLETNIMYVDYISALKRWHASNDSEKRYKVSLSLGTVNLSTYRQMEREV